MSDVTRYWIKEPLVWDDEDAELANQMDVELTTLGYVAVYKAPDYDALARQLADSERLAELNAEECLRLKGLLDERDSLESEQAILVVKAMEGER